MTGVNYATRKTINFQVIYNAQLKVKRANIALGLALCAPLR